MSSAGVQVTLEANKAQSGAKTDNSSKNDLKEKEAGSTREIGTVFLSPDHSKSQGYTEYTIKRSAHPSRGNSQDESISPEGPKRQGKENQAL